MTNFSDGCIVRILVNQEQIPRAVVALLPFSGAIAFLLCDLLGELPLFISFATMLMASLVATLVGDRLGGTAITVTPNGIVVTTGARTNAYGTRSFEWCHRQDQVEVLIPDYLSLGGVARFTLTAAQNGNGNEVIDIMSRLKAPRAGERGVFSYVSLAKRVVAVVSLCAGLVVLASVEHVGQWIGYLMSGVLIVVVPAPAFGFDGVNAICRISVFIGLSGMVLGLFMNVNNSTIIAVLIPIVGILGCLVSMLPWQNTFPQTLAETAVGSTSTTESRRSDARFG